MSLTKIAGEIDRRAETRQIGRLQEIRQEIKGLSRLAYHQIFHPQTIFEDGEGSYAFHYGGRKELQFNIGFEPKKKFRHGVAYSFEPSRTLPEPELLLPSVERFNEFLRRDPDQFSNMLMWHWDENGRSPDRAPLPISARLIRRGVFVFLGRTQPADTINYDIVLQDFDRLLPLYRFVEGSDSVPHLTEPPKQGFQFRPGCTIKPAATTASVAERRLNISLRHNELQLALYKHLAALYGENSVGTERGSAGGLVDVVVNQSGDFWFYEIKTATSARGCIREAIAQLLEYSYWPGAQVAKRLIIVGEPVLDQDSERYLSTLRKQFSLPIEYHQFDLANGRIVSN